MNGRTGIATPKSRFTAGHSEEDTFTIEGTTLSLSTPAGRGPAEPMGGKGGHNVAVESQHPPGAFRIGLGQGPRASAEGMTASGEPP